MGIKYKDPTTGQFKDISVKVADSLPIGTEVDYDGETVPTGWEQVDNPNDYSTTETRIGTWIDGKPLYRKVIDFGALPNASEKSVEHNISDLDNVIKYSAISKNTQYGSQFPIPLTSTAGLTSNIYIYFTLTNIVIGTGSDRTSFTQTYVILEYTKVTD